QWGMSDKLGPVGYAENQQEVFLGAQLTQIKNVSEATAQQIDSEIRRLVETGYGKAREILTEKLDLLHALARALLEHETLTGEEIAAVMRGEPVTAARRPVEGSTGVGGIRRGSVPTSAGPESGDAAPGISPSPQPGT
ncbi:MAG: cell division protein FtsH, partial [Geminicoccaceae bacterium]|nr:cell division protein FtsH [Geminicoccaceae bacterium]